MNEQYKETVAALKKAEDALKTLKAFEETQHKAKGKTMLNQIVNYIADVLHDSNYICGCKYCDLALSKMRDRFIFYIYDNSMISSGHPIFSIDFDGETVDHCKLDDEMILTLIRYWEGFKKELHANIKTCLEERTKTINKELAHIAYVNEQLSKWHV